MQFIQLTRHDGEHVWVNLEHVSQMVRTKDATVLQFAASGGERGVKCVTVQEIPKDIFRKV